MKNTDVAVVLRESVEPISCSDAFRKSAWREMR
jgi:hypothetical protein